MELKISRRNFLKATGLAGAGVAISGSSALLTKKAADKALAQEQANDEKVVQTWCQMCSSGKTFCGLNCYVKNGRFTNVEGNPDFGNAYGVGSKSVCLKGNASMQVPYAPNRLKYPMKRVGEKGEGKFKRISWDEAYKIIGDKYKETKEQYGAESLGMLSPEHWMPIATLGRRLLNVHGSPNYMHSQICVAQRMASRNCTSSNAFGLAPGDPSPKQPDKTKLFVGWGNNFENSGPNKRTSRLSAQLDSVEKGAKYIDIRPMLNPMGTKADLWLAIRPGTDGALALAILHVIIGENLYDHDFVSEWCYGFEELAEYVKQFTPEWAAEETGLPVEKIIQAARMMGTIKPMCIMEGNGIGDQVNDGFWGAIAIYMIEAITGNLDIPGGGGALPPTGPPLIEARDIGTLPEKAPDDMLERLVAPEFPLWYQEFAGVCNTGYHTGLKSILTKDPYPLRVLQASRTTPLSATRDTHMVAEALMELEFLYTAECYYAPHLPYSDVVLPACTGYEHSHQIAVDNREDGTFLTITGEVVPPMYESKSDWEIFLGIATAAGYGEDFWDGDIEAMLRWQLEPSGISLEELREGWVFVPRTEPVPDIEYRRYEAIFERMPYGKFPLYNTLVGGKPDLNNNPMPYLPVYTGPPESITNTPELLEEYPVILSDVHADRRAQHSYYNDLPYTRELGPYPWCIINPATAKKYGIDDGDWMKVESLHGWCVLKAEYYEGISPEVLMSRRGWWQSCPELNKPGYIEFNGGAEVNVMYNADQTLFDPMHSGMTKQTLVKISKTGPPETRPDINVTVEQ